MIMISKSGDRLSVLNGPLDLTQELGIGLRAAFPRRITTDRATEDGLHIFEVKKATYGGACAALLLLTPRGNAHTHSLISAPGWHAPSWTPDPSTPVSLRIGMLPRIPSPATAQPPAAVTVDKSELVAFVLRFFNNVGIRLCGSVPMGTRSFFHLGQRKELWVFRAGGDAYRPPPGDVYRSGSAGRHKEYGPAPGERERERRPRPSSRQSRRGEHEPVPMPVP